MGNSKQNTEDKGIIELAKESAGQDHTFGKEQIFNIVKGLTVGVIAWNVAQKHEGFRKVFNFPAELITTALHKITGIDRDSIALGVREIYDVFIFGPLITLASVLSSKSKNKVNSTPNLP